MKTAKSGFGPQHKCLRCSFSFEADKIRCPSCKFFNTAGPPGAKQGEDQTILLSDVDDDAKDSRLITGPWDICFGGGINTASVTLLGGEPGAGKSTMSLQLADAIAMSTRREVLYIAAEEANRDVKARFKRLNLLSLSLIRMFPIGSNDDVGAILMRYKPAAFILDSLPGLIGDDLAAAVELCHALKGYCVALDCPAIVIDHVTKEKEFAGRMSLQHAVDTTMLFTVDDADKSRELSTVKNRFGAANVSVYFDMTSTGLRKLDYDDDEDEEEDGEEEEDDEDE